MPGASLTTRSDDCFPFCWFLLFQSEAAITVACWARLPLATGRNRRHQYYLVLLGLPSFAPIRQVEPDLIECSIQSTSLQPIRVGLTGLSDFVFHSLQPSQVGLGFSDCYRHAQNSSTAQSTVTPSALLASPAHSVRYFASFSTVSSVFFVPPSFLAVPLGMPRAQ